MMMKMTMMTTIRITITRRSRIFVGALLLAGFLVACGEGRESVFRTDVLVNDPSVDRGNNTTQSETAVARHGDVVVIGYNDSGEFTSAPPPPVREANNDMH